MCPSGRIDFLRVIESKVVVYMKNCWPNYILQIVETKNFKFLLFHFPWYFLGS